MSFIQAVSNSVDFWWCLPNWRNLHVCPHHPSSITSSKRCIRRYDGGNIVSRSIDLDQPVIYVSMNYRWALSFILLCITISDTAFSVLAVCFRSIACGLGLIYRFPTALGFMPGKEVKKAGVGNLGLQDRKSLILRFRDLLLIFS